MGTYIIPTIGLKGTYSLKTPFDSLLIASEEYTCQAIRSINELLADNQDPFALAYQPAGLQQTDYATAKSENMMIVFLASDTGHWVYVPADYILSYPNMNGIPYHVVGLSVNLGPQPSSSDLSALITKIQNIVKDTIGVAPAVKTVQLSKPTLVSDTDHTAIQTARDALVTESDSDSAKYQRLLQDLATANTQLAAAEAYIKAHWPPP